MDPNSITITHTELDLSLRLVEVWFDMTWAFYMSSSVDHVAKHIDRHRRSVSSTASVASSSSLAEGSVAGKSMREKLHVLEHNLKNVKVLMKPRQFEDICKVSLMSNDDLYPGFKDVLLIAQHLIKHAKSYHKTLTSDEVNDLTLALIFQYIYFQLCDFLLTTQTGREAMKLIIMPSKITHATYDICRQKFCRLLCDEPTIVQYGLFHMIKKLVRDRESDVKDPPPESSPVPPAPPASPASPASPAPPTSPAPPASPPEEAAVVEAEAPTSSRKASFATVPFHSRTAGRGQGSISFPMIDLSSSDEDDYSDSSVSSLEDEV